MSFGFPFGEKIVKNLEINTVIEVRSPSETFISSFPVGNPSYGKGRFRMGDVP